MLGVGIRERDGVSDAISSCLHLRGRVHEHVVWLSCANSGLSQTGDQIHEWADNLEYYQHTRKFVYANSDVWASDITEDKMGGEDWLYGDAVDLYAYSGTAALPS